MTLLRKSLTTLVCSALLGAAASASATSSAWSYMTYLADDKSGIGSRLAGSKEERKAANWLAQQWQQQGYQAEILNFDFHLEGKALKSQNVVVDIPGESDKVLIVGAHYDSTGHEHGSTGFTDNASGVAALLALSEQLKGKTLPYSVRLIAFGAEEVGLEGSIVYVADQLKDKTKVLAMINLDTIIGGDNLYVHSAHSTTPYDCEYIPAASYNSQAHVRDGLVEVSNAIYGQQGHRAHAAYEGYPIGVTNGWSDHAPFACAGIPIGYLEATSFTIDGIDGHDGYSQTDKPQLWDCYDSENKTACDREQEQSWGMIWHTRFDRLDTLEPIMKDRLKQQLDKNVNVLEQFVLQANKYI